MKKRNTLWMRFVDFENIKKMLHLVCENNGQLRAGELERLGIEKGVLVKKGSVKPMTHTPRYHYRKVMENLGLVEVRQKRYYVSEDSKVQDFLEMTDFELPMSYEAKEIIRSIVVENRDCKNFFFDIFVEKDSYTLEDLRKQGDPVFVETKSMRDFSKVEWMTREVNRRDIHKKKKIGTIILENPAGKKIELKTQDEIHAIYWGVRLWAVELGITNEVMTSFSEGRIIYPVNPHFSEKILIERINNLIKMDRSDSKWILIHIPSFIKEIALKYRFPIYSVKDFLLEIKMEHPSLIMFIPSSTVFIDIRTPFESQDSAIRNLYLYRKGKGFMSHMRIRKNILEEV